jgi:hypothetical protein
VVDAVVEAVVEVLDDVVSPVSLVVLSPLDVVDDSTVVAVAVSDVVGSAVWTSSESSSRRTRMASRATITRRMATTIATYHGGVPPGPEPGPGDPGWGGPAPLDPYVLFPGGTVEDM